VKAAHYPVIVWIGFFCHRKKDMMEKGRGSSKLRQTVGNNRKMKLN